MIKILHTSDWHIGKRLYSKKRYGEFNAFLDWLVEEIKARSIGILIVAGDIFDTTTPSNTALRLYYQFLRDVSVTCCRHVVIIGGNHDSPSLLEAPRELLEVLNVRVVASVPENREDQVLLLENEAGECELIVCTVPYLRDRDIRASRPGESGEEKEQILQESIGHHYAEVVAIARTKQAELAPTAPIVATGHLFAAGGRVVEGDGVRDLYVGSLLHVPATIFAPQIDYLALGHLHSAQILGGDPSRRYSGSPLPMSFKEAEKEKYVIEVEIENSEVSAVPVRIPTFQRLHSIHGDYEHILSEIEKISRQARTVWLEILYEGKEIIPDMHHKLQKEIEGSPLEILRIINRPHIINSSESELTVNDLESMSEEDVFIRCLEAASIPADQQDDLLLLFKSTLQQLAEEESNTQ